MSGGVGGRGLATPSYPIQSCFYGISTKRCGNKPRKRLIPANIKIKHVVVNDLGDMTLIMVMILSAAGLLAALQAVNHITRCKGSMPGAIWC